MSDLVNQESSGSANKAHVEPADALSTPPSLGEPEHFLQSILDALAEPIMVIDADYRVRLLNRAAEQVRLLGPSADTLYCYQVSHHRDAPCSGEEHPCPLVEVRNKGSGMATVHQHYGADGALRFVEVLAAPLWGPDGQFTGIVESLHDITERQKAQESLQRNAERLRALSVRLAEVSEVEKQRLARELHDQVGQNLTAIGINLTILRDQLDRQSALARSRIDESLSLLEQTAARIRDLMADLRPPVLDDYGLVAALHWYGEQFSRRAGIHVSVEGREPEPRLNTAAESALFRIVQEALTNVAKHAQASNVWIRVQVDESQLRLEVDDDGIGFDSDRTHQPGMCLGLVTMAERAEAVGGVCQVQSHAGRGTVVQVRVPR